MLIRYSDRERKENGNVNAVKQRHTYLREPRQKRRISCVHTLGFREKERERVSVCVRAIYRACDSLVRLEKQERDMVDDLCMR